MEFHDLKDWADLSKSALDMLNAALALMPKTEKRAEAETKIAQASELLRRADAKLAKDLGYRLCECEYPPRPMLWRETERAYVCQNPACGRRDKWPDDNGSALTRSSPFV